MNLLKDIRIKRNMTQSDLADLSNVNVRMIQHYEQGFKDINKAKLETLIDLSIALKCSISDLLNDHELIRKCERASL